MIVKIGDDFFDSDNEPIMVIFSDDEKKYITEMPEGYGSFCATPKDTSPEEVEAFMNLDEFFGDDNEEEDEEKLGEETEEDINKVSDEEKKE